jgi:hypothetical protein
MSRTPVIALAVALTIVVSACGGAETAETSASTSPTTAPDAATTTGSSDTTADASTTSTSSSTFTAEVWADNWFALYVNGELVGEDSVPITTERSFNSETFTFDADYPLTIAIEAKDFKENDSGLEYIGQPNQQMGDGGLIAQFTDTATGDVVAVTDGSWSALVIHRAPLNPECESDADPTSTCESESSDAPDDWTSAGFDDAAWSAATVWSAAEVSPKDGYDAVSWDSSAELVWGSDLETDNTVLLRTTAS